MRLRIWPSSSSVGRIRESHRRKAKLWDGELKSGMHSDHPFRIHLLQLSTFEPHPLALEPTVTHHAPIPVAQISVRCLGSLVGVIFHSIEADNVEQTLIIVNWQTGETKAVSTLDLDMSGSHSAPGSAVHRIPERRPDI